MRWEIVPLKVGSGSRQRLEEPQETQLEVVETEVMGNRLSLGPCLRDVWMDTCLCNLGPKRYCIKYPIKIITLV